MAPSWGLDSASDGCGEPSLQQLPSAEDEQMIRHLASRYSPAELARLFQKVGVNSRAIPDDQASIISTSTYQSSNQSEDAPSIFDNGSVRSFSDTSSITSSIFSNVSSKLLGRKSGSSSAQAAAVAQAQVQAQQEAAAWNEHESTPTPTAMVEPVAAAPQPALDLSAPTSSTPKVKAAFKCGFCDEEGIVKTCTRKNDLKRHIEDFHNMNAQWFCRHRGCQMVFDWQTAYKTHLKTAHGGSRMSLDEAKVNLCPQVVFACGFENCLQVFEAPGDTEAPQTFKEYVSHVVKHFDEGSQSGEWSYSTRMRNLLRQAQVNAAVADMGDLSRYQLEWLPQTSGVLRKRLECRHIGDVKLLVHYAVELGTNNRITPKFREDFVTPIKDSCSSSGPGHIARKAAVSPPQEDPFTFRISRGANPQLAQYINAQRRIVVSRHQHVRRSHGYPHSHSHPHQHPHHQSRPPIPTSMPTSSPMSVSMNGHNPTQHYFAPLPDTAPPSSPMYDQTQQPFSPTTTMMSPTGGIIADDLRSLRSFTSGSPEPDVDMTDSPPMMNADYSAPYVTAPLASPIPDGLSSPAAIDHSPTFYHDDQQIAHHPHAY